MKNFNTKNALLNIINSEDCVNDILEKNEDKIYLYAKNIIKSNKTFDLFIDSSNCLVVLNKKIINSIKTITEKYNIELNIKMPTVDQIRNGKVEGILFSAGVIAKNNNNDCLMLERDEYAPSEQNCWQFPAGRCEEINIINTAKKEVREEISVINPTNNMIVSVADKIKEKHNDYSVVNISVDDNLITTNKNFAVLDSDFNTLEQFYFSNINDSENNLILKDNEFDRKVGYVSLKMLKNNEIKMIKLLNKEKVLFSKCFKSTTKKIKLN